MSARAIQRLRKEREQELAAEAESEDDSEDDDEVSNRPAAGGFSGLMDDDSDSESSSSEDDNESDRGSDSGGGDSKDEGNAEAIAVDQSIAGSETNDDGKKIAGKSEDLDSILEEFKSQDAQVAVSGSSINKESVSRYAIITNGMDIRDLDIDHVSRTSLLGRNDSAAGSANRRGRQLNVFGPPRDGWPRPPRYVGGGIGMTTYENEPHSLPWPYCDMKEGDDRCPGADRWFKFMHSDSYERDCEDFDRVKQSGDPNAMALFIAHHPFVVEPLLQLSTVLYQTNQAQEGLSMLKRVLWIFECACLNSFLKLDGASVMDFALPENENFFAALFRLVRVSYVAGLSRACLGVSRLLLSLDPLRDPMCVLLAMDHFALLENTESNDLWLVEFVESNKVQICWRDEPSGEEYESSLLDLPNWAYSYALALYRVYEKNSSPESEARAADALRTALKRFPSVLEDLLIKNEVNLTGRSFQTDWPSVMGFARTHETDLSTHLSKKLSPVLKARVSQSCALVSRIFVQQNFKLWSSDRVQKWCFDQMHHLKMSGIDVNDVPMVSPAIIRYERSEPADYEPGFQTMPADANPLDPALVAHAQNIDPNRPRLVQRGPRGGFNQDDFALAANQQGLAFAGPPTQEIDPDWPLLEIFWRSALPWAHVEGVPPPRR